MYNGYGLSYPGGKVANPWRLSVTLSSAEIKERVELYFYSPSESPLRVLRWVLPLPLHLSKPWVAIQKQTENKFTEYLYIYLLRKNWATVRKQTENTLTEYLYLYLLPKNWATLRKQTGNKFTEYLYSYLYLYQNTELPCGNNQEINSQNIFIFTFTFTEKLSYHAKITRK